MGQYEKTSYYLKGLSRGVIGSTTVFGTVSLGSSPSEITKIKSYEKTRITGCKKASTNQFH